MITCMSHTEKHCKNYKSFLEIMFFLSVLSDGKVSMVVFVRKLEVVHKQVGGCLISNLLVLGSWRLSDQMGA